MAEEVQQNSSSNKDVITFQYVVKTGAPILSAGILTLAGWWFVVHRGSMDSLHKDIDNNARAIAVNTAAISSVVTTLEQLGKGFEKIGDNLEKNTAALTAMDNRLTAIESNRFTATQAMVTNSEIRRDMSDLQRAVDRVEVQLEQLIESKDNDPP